MTAGKQQHVVLKRYQRDLGFFSSFFFAFGYSENESSIKTVLIFFLLTQPDSTKNMNFAFKIKIPVCDS